MKMQRECIKTIEPKKEAIKEWDAYLEVRKHTPSACSSLFIFIAGLF